jgi:hypothetical protein
MKKALCTASIALTMVCLIAASDTRANCQYDVVGTTQSSPEWSFTPDGQVTFGMPNWWEDDIYACYNTYLNPAYMIYFSACDFDGSGAVEMQEVLDMYYFVLDYPTGGVPRYAYQCDDGFQCPGDMPAFYDPSGSDVEWTASGVCTEMNGPSGPPACPQEQYDRLVRDMNHILATYPWTNAVFDGSAGAGQSFSVVPYSLICFAASGEAFPTDLFNDINACYHGTPDWLFDESLAIFYFDWGVNAHRALTDYGDVAGAVGGGCELNMLVGGPATGFHAFTQPGWTWVLWTVRSTDACDLYGCRCDATLEVWSNIDGTYVERSMTNDSTFVFHHGLRCEDPRFDF